MSIQFPNAPSFETVALQPPPAISEYKTVEQKVDAIHNFLNAQFVALNDMQTSIGAGWLIDTVRILNLEANIITSESIFTQKLYVGEDQNIELDGTSDRIDVYDSQGTPELRTRIGNLGAGNDNWGQQWWDSSGTLIMEVGDTTFINGGIIVDATISNAKIVNATITGSKVDSLTLTGSNMANSTVTDGKLVTVGATKITGTLTIDGNPSLVVASGGTIQVNAGGDINFRASSGNYNYQIFKDSGGTSRGNITWNSSTSSFIFRRADKAMRIDLSTNLTLEPGTDTIVLSGDTIYGDMKSDLDPDIDSIRDIGISSRRCSDIWSDLVNGSDIGLDNGMRMIEPDKFRDDLDPTDGWILTNKEWEIVAWIHKDGRAEFAGNVTGNVIFPEANISKRNPTDREYEAELLSEMLIREVEEGKPMPLENTPRYLELKKQARLREKEINGRRPIEEARQDLRRTENRRRNAVETTERITQ